MPKIASTLTAIIETKDGNSLEGSVVRVDELWVTLGLADGTQRTFRRDNDLKLVMRDALARHKALLPTYTDRDIHDVTTFLSTLRGVSQASAGQSGRTPDGKNPGAVLLHPSKRSSGVVPETILRPLAHSWLTHTGDYTGRRYSHLKQIDQSNVKELKLAWVARLVAGPLDPGPHPTVIEGVGDRTVNQPTQIRGSMLMAEGVLYASMPDNAWAIDARNGRVIWHTFWKSRGGHHFSNRGLGMWNDSIFMSTPDSYLVSLDARTGSKRWHVETANFEEQYFSSAAPVVIGNQVLVGSATVVNGPGYLQSFDAETGQAQWRHYSVPMSDSDTGIETWKDLESAKHGGGSVWNGGVYDPETNLYIYGTGNPTPAYIAALRGDKDALFTCAVLAVNVTSGKLAWYYQVSPNDTHDWDAAQTPVLADIWIDGRLRKVAMTSARNGFFFVLDRITGEHLVTNKFSNAANWAQPRLNANGQPMRLPEKDFHPSGALVSPGNAGAANWFPASYSPDYGLFYVHTSESWALYYSRPYQAGGRPSEGGKLEIPIHREFSLSAIEPRTGRTQWRVQHPLAGGFPNGVLTTAGRVLFAGDSNGNLIARDPGTGAVLWHASLGATANTPQTYLLDGYQYLVAAAGDAIFAFTVEP